MTTIIKNGTVVTADLTYKADVRVENGVITEIGQGLKGGSYVFLPACLEVAEVVG
jgi:dihydropyrimidinase